VLGETVVREPALRADTVMAEACRHAVWVFSNGGSSAVATARLRHWLRPVSIAFSGATPPATDEPWRRVLDDLAEIGDVTRLEKGRWLPGVARLVPRTPGRTLVLGGPPLALISSEIRRALSAEGLVRLRQNDAPPESLRELDQWPVESDASWRSSSPGELADWGTRLLATTRLQPAENVEVHEWYGPVLAARHTPQHRRWFSIGSSTPDGRYLVRYQSMWGRRRAVGLVEGGRVLAIGIPAVNPGGFRRLQYALDAAAGVPTKAVVDLRAASAILTLFDRLPGAEFRLVVALGQRVDTGGAEHQSDSWVFSPADIADVWVELRDQLKIDVEIRRAIDAEPRRGALS